MFAVLGGNLYVSGNMSNAGAILCLVEQDELEADFANRLRTARGFGFGFDDLSSKEIRIPSTVRKKMTATVVVVMRMRCLGIINFLLYVPHKYRFSAYVKCIYYTGLTLTVIKKPLLEWWKGLGLG
jgi:hypothetical protein